jgi:glycerol-1-phosphate dehydrogenase [NAD(P)+]
MTICNGSYPASQGEHLLSHYVEMMKPPGLPPTFHGEQIAACTVAMAELQERLLDGDAPRIRPAKIDRSAVVQHFGAPIGEACWREFELKQFDVAALEARLAGNWDAIRARIGGVTVGAAKLRGLLAAAGAPVEPRQLGWPAELFAQALVHAREIRNRYTFLDLAADCATA